ncbi:hypothetical protein D1872_173680 [compost metagenome]
MLFAVRQDIQIRNPRTRLSQDRRQKLLVMTRQPFHRFLSKQRSSVLNLANQLVIGFHDIKAKIKLCRLFLDVEQRPLQAFQG